MWSSNFINLTLFVLFGIYPSIILFRDIKDDHDDMGFMGSIITATAIDILCTFLPRTDVSNTIISVMLLLESSMCFFMSMRCIVAAPITISHDDTDPNGGGSLDNYILIGYLLLVMAMIAHHRKSEN